MNQITMRFRHIPKLASKEGEGVPFASKDWFLKPSYCPNNRSKIDG